MGLSSKQVSGNGLDWAHHLLQADALDLPKPPQQQQQQQQGPPLKCPRCESTNTKFCYFNNYNRSQPRHFCKSCRRHWTKGGTLRNVPVGGGRKNKRLKTTTTNNNHESRGANVANQQQQQRHLPLAFRDQKNISEILYQALLQPPSSQPDYINSNNEGEKMNSFLGSSLSLPPLPNFPFITSSFENNPSSISSSFTGTAQFQSSNLYNYTGESETAEDPTSTSTSTSNTSAINPSWQLPNTGSFIDSSSNWSWDDLNTLISTDLNQSWDDSQNKQQGI